MRIKTLNGSVTDISKRTIQSICRKHGFNSVQASRMGDPTELIIVKTNLNYGGYGEKKLSLSQREALGIGPFSHVITNANDYKILHRSEIAPSWWEDPALALERFVENGIKRKYRVYFLEERFFISQVIDEERIKKYREDLNRTNLLLTRSELKEDSDIPLPSSLKRQLLPFIDQFSLNFGAIDIVEDDFGECYIIDVNSTPYWRTLDPTMLLHLRGAFPMK